MAKEQKIINIRKLGKGGLNTYDDPQDVDDLEVVEAENMLFDNAAEVRPGSVKLWSKPTGETGDPTCLFDAHTSDGLQYVIAVYAPNFYLRDEQNDQWIKINQTYTPSIANAALMYSYINWNAGRTADTLYACNGTDNFLKWPIFFTYTTVQIIPSDMTVTVNDASYMPTAGDLVVKELGGIEYVLPYTSKTGNVINLTNVAGVSIGNGAGVSGQIYEVPGMAKGKVIARHQRRLFVANYYGGEANMKYSNVEAPEDFSTGSGVAKGGALTISDGNGGITLMTDFGQYLIVSKEDAIVHFELQYNATLDAKLDLTFPVVSDKSMGPINVWSTIKKNKTVYYPTATEGILDISPIATGNSTSIGVEVKSQKIQPTYKGLNFETSRTTTFLNKILWSCASNTANDTVLVYDTLRDYWTKINNWDVKDWCLHNSTLLFVSRVTGDIYQAFVENRYDDNDDPYVCSFLSKDYDFGEPSLPKTMTNLFLQGSISSTTELFFDITAKQGNRAVTITYSILGNGIFVNRVIPEAMAMIMMGVPIMGMGSSLSLTNNGDFKVYLAIPIRNGFYTINFKPYSKKAGDYWKITGAGFNPELVTQIPAMMVQGSIGDPTITGATTIDFSKLQQENEGFILY